MQCCRPGIDAPSISAHHPHNLKSCPAGDLFGRFSFPATSSDHPSPALIAWGFSLCAGSALSSPDVTYRPLPDREWTRMQSSYGVSGVPPMVCIARTGLSAFPIDAPSFQRRPSKGYEGKARTGAGANKAADVGNALRAAPAAIGDDIDRQIVSLLCQGSSRYVVASLVGIGQGTVKKRVKAMQERAAVAG